MTKAELVRWLEGPDALRDIQRDIRSLDPMPAPDQTAWSLARIADEIRSCDDPQAEQWAKWAVCDQTRTLVHRTLYAAAPDSESIRPIILAVVRGRVLQD